MGQIAIVAVSVNDSLLGPTSYSYLLLSLFGWTVAGLVFASLLTAQLARERRLKSPVLLGMLVSAAGFTLALWGLGMYFDTV